MSKEDEADTVLYLQQPGEKGQSGWKGAKMQDLHKSMIVFFWCHSNRSNCLIRECLHNFLHFQYEREDKARVTF